MSGDDRWEPVDGDERGVVLVHAEAPSDDVVRSFYECPDSLAMMLWRDKSTTFAEAVGDLLAERRDLAERLAKAKTLLRELRVLGNELSIATDPVDDFLFDEDRRNGDAA